MTGRPLPKSDLDHVLSHTEQCWEALRNERVFVTGGTGFFGAWLLESFAYANQRLQLGAEAVVLVRKPNAFSEMFPHLASRMDIKIHPGDVRDFSFPDGQFRCVIHAATTAAHVIDPLENFSVIVDGTRRVLDFAARAGVQEFLITSSGAIYGRQPTDLLEVPESYCGAPDPLLPGSTYGECKRASELLGALYHQRFGTKVKIARCFAFVGPHLPLEQHFAIGNFIRDALVGAPIHVSSDGTPIRSYLYAADLAIWLWRLLIFGAPNRAYNVGSRQEISIGDLARKFGPTTIAGKPDGSPPARYLPDISRASNELSLKVWVELDDAIRRTLAWFRGE